MLEAIALSVINTSSLLPVDKCTLMSNNTWCNHFV